MSPVFSTGDMIHTTLYQAHHRLPAIMFFTYYYVYADNVLFISINSCNINSEYGWLLLYTKY